MRLLRKTWLNFEREAFLKDGRLWLTPVIFVNLTLCLPASLKQQSKFWLLLCVYVCWLLCGGVVELTELNFLKLKMRHISVLSRAEKRVGKQQFGKSHHKL
jgi:hypothetical protein